MNLSILKKDIPAGIVVFLVALPLCLGVALASGAPLLSGVIAGIIGGIVVGFLSGSQTSVSGPAAGLTAVVLASITQLGSFEIFLLAVVIAGILQLGMGLLKGGIIANYFPSNVIKGLLAAIGIILILKQIPHALGYDAVPEESFTFSDPKGENTFSSLMRMLDFITPGALVISILSILVMVFWDKTPLKKFSFFPSSLFVVLLGVGLNAVFNAWLPAFQVEPTHLVNLPPIDFSNPGAYFHLPDLSYFSDAKVYTVAVTIAAVASLETLLNIEAIDKLDPHKRETPPNRELVAQGVGNIAAGFLGGLPVTSVIVRSSVNINSGNKSKLSTILHGFLLLTSILVLAPIMNLIPLASLAAILIITGYKLAKVSIFKDMYKKGWHQFIPFVVTIIAIVLTDLLIGIGLGLAVSIFFLLRNNFRNPFNLRKQKLHIGEVIQLELSDEVSFLNKASIKDTLWSIKDDSKVMVDASRSSYIDDDVLEIIEDFRSTVAPERNIQLNIVGLKRKYELPDSIHFVPVLDAQTQKKLSPREILELLKEGNKRFYSGGLNYKPFHHQRDATHSEQHPMAVIVSCIDSRTSPEIIFDAGIGDLVTIRIAGNIISPEIIGSIELAVRQLGIRLIVVMGHSNCGTIYEAVEHEKNRPTNAITSKISKMIDKAGNITKIDTSSRPVMEKLTRLNIRNSMEEIISQSRLLGSAIESKKIGIVGGYYRTRTGMVEFGELMDFDSVVEQGVKLTPL